MTQQVHVRCVPKEVKTGTQTPVQTRAQGNTQRKAGNNPGSLDGRMEEQNVVCPCRGTVTHRVGTGHAGTSG